MTVRLIYLLAPLSGALALIYQILWQRQLRLILGSGPESFALTVGLFVGGLSLGYLYFSEKTKSEHLLKWIIGSEILVGAFAWFTAATVAMVTIPLLFAIPLILVPVFVMGAFMPLCSQYSVRKKLTARPESFLYGIHGIGSALGAWTAGLILLPFLGTQITFVITGLIHFLVALCFGILDLQQRRNFR